MTAWLHDSLQVPVMQEDEIKFTQALASIDIFTSKDCTQCAQGAKLLLSRWRRKNERQ